MLTVFILLGGQSRRMGQPKQLVSLGSEPAWLRMVQLVRSLRHVDSRIVLVGKQAPDHLPADVTFLPDILDAQNPLIGIATALAWTQSDWNLILAVDYPLLIPAVIEALEAARASNDDVCIPSEGDTWHPLVGFYHRRVAKVVEQAAQNPSGRVRDFLQGLRVRVVSLDTLLPEKSFHEALLNMNCPEDLRKVQRLVSQDDQQRPCSKYNDIRLHNM